MQLHLLDHILISFFVLFIVLVIYRGFQKETTDSDFLNAGGKLHWLTICASIIGTNIAFEYILSSAGNGFTVGFAYASYEWGAIIIMIISALYFIPKFIQIGVLTLPEYLEHRFNKKARFLMAILFVCMQFGMLLPSLLANSIFLEKVFFIPRIFTIGAIALVGSLILVAGGMRSKLRVDVVVFFLFIITSIIILTAGFIKLEGLNNFVEAANDKLNVLLPADHETLPWTSVFVGGLWIVHVKYWTFFQPIAQTALASGSLSKTQKGYLAAATMKLLTPVFIIVPGIMAYEMYSAEITSPDMVFPVFIQNTIPQVFTGLIAVTYLGIMITCYMGYLNATAVILSLDIVNPVLRYFGYDKDRILITRLSTFVLMILSVLMTYHLKLSGTIFEITQILLLSITPISCSVFLFAMFSRKTPSFAPITAMLAGMPIFFALKNWLSVSLLDVSGITFIFLAGFIGVCRLLFPMGKAVLMPEKFAVKFERNLAVTIWSIFILTSLLGLYSLFM